MTVSQRQFYSESCEVFLHANQSWYTVTHTCIEHGHLYPFCNVHSSDLQVLQELVLGVEDVQQVVTRLFVHSVHHVLELAGGVLTKHHISCNRQRQPSTTLSRIWRHLQL